MVTVSIKGTNKATHTAEDGTYAIDVTPNQQLVFSMIGFDRQSFTVGKKQTINVTMRETTETKMQDLVVVGMMGAAM